MRLDWHKQDVPEVALNNQTVPPATAVWLASKHHRGRPQGYEVYEVVPKILWRWGEKHLRPSAWSCDAIAAKPRSRSSSRSDAAGAVSEVWQTLR
jgi:hypothetical protein